ncbi:MAG: MMPL family transporter [Deltaproteobacteria bacterium]|nr:MMPL family transporter [Deltaproteobacteria bacterium]
MNSILRFTSAHPWLVLLLTLGLTALAGSQIVDLRTGELRLEIDPSPNRFLPAEDEAKIFYDLVRKVFGSDETLLVVLGAEDVFTRENLERLDRMTKRIGSVDGVHHVVSLTNAINIRGVGDDLEIAPFVSRIPDDPEELARLRREALDHPIFAGNLVSRDGRSAALLVYFMDFTDTEFIARGIDDQIGEIVEQERGDALTWITGTPHLKVVQIRMLFADLGRNLPLILVVGMIVLAFSFRNLRGVFLPALTVVVALVWTMGIAAWIGRPLNLVTVLVPPLLMILGLAYAVHVVSEYYDTLHEEPDGGNESVTVRAVKKVGLPVLLTGLTTAASFLALMLSPMAPIREMGLLALVGILIAVVASLIVTPAMLEALGPPRRTGHAGQEAQSDWFGRFAARAAEFNLRNRTGIFVACAVFGVLALVAATQIRVGTEHIGTFKKDHPTRIAFEAVNERLGGANSFNVVVQASYPNAFKEPANLRELESIQHWLDGQPEIGATTSVVDYLKLINRGFHGNDPNHLAIPESRRLTGQLFFFGANDEIENFVDKSYRMANVVVRANVIDSDRILDLSERIEQRLEQLPEHLKGTVTGNPILINRMLETVVRGQVLSLGGALILIYIILSLLFLSARTGLIALIPNVLPIAAFFGALGVSGVMLSPGTSMIASMALGVAIDDTIHYFARFNQDAKRFANERLATISALRAVGRPVTYTSIAICLGFLVLTTSELSNFVEIGALGAFTLAFAWLIDFTLTPALCSGLRVVTLWDTLTLDLGHSPSTSIPLFKGLSTAQARILALMASLRRVPAGQRLIRMGDEGRELWVIIDGKLRVSVPRGEGEIELGTCTRGDVIGEIAFFGQRRSANVDVVEDSRLLRLTPGNLARLGRRYPRIATQVLSNLSEVLAERLVKTTSRLR